MTAAACGWLDAISAALDAEIQILGLDFTGDRAVDIALADAALLYAGEGRHRVVFRYGDRVVKIPRGEWGLASNSREASISADAEANGGVLFGIAYARCHLHGTNGALLVMDAVDPVADEDAPEWAACIDCKQVGRDPSGRVVAYDFGY